MDAILTSGCVILFASLFLFLSVVGQGNSVGNPFEFLGVDGGACRADLLGAIIGAAGTVASLVLLAACCGGFRRLPPVRHEMPITAGDVGDWLDACVQRGKALGFRVVEADEFRFVVCARSSPPERLTVEVRPRGSGLSGRITHEYRGELVDAGETERAARLLAWVAGESGTVRPRPRGFPSWLFGLHAVVFSWATAGTALAASAGASLGGIASDLSAAFVAAFSILALLPIPRAGAIGKRWAVQALLVVGASLGVLAYEAKPRWSLSDRYDSSAIQEGTAAAERDYAAGRAAWRRWGLYREAPGVDQEYGIPFLDGG